MNVATHGVGGLTDWWYGLVDAVTGEKTIGRVVAAGAVLMSPVTYVGEGARYAVQSGLDAGGRAVTYVWDTTTHKVIDEVYGTPGLPHLPGPPVPDTMDPSGRVTDPEAVDKLIDQSWAAQQAYLRSFFVGEAERADENEFSRSIWLYLLVAGGAVLLIGSIPRRKD
jgi:hypothetical protein